MAICYRAGPLAGLLPEHPSTLRERADHETTLTLRPGSRTLQFIVWPGGSSILQQLLCENGKCFSRLGRLGLPASVRPWSYNDTEAILLADAVVHLPALRTVAIECAARRPEAESLPVLDCVGGTIRAPALARIEIVAAAPPNALTDVERVDAARLAAFIRDSVVRDDRDALELFVDTAHGVQLDGNLAALRACVGSLVI